MNVAGTLSDPMQYPGGLLAGGNPGVGFGSIHTDTLRAAFPEQTITNEQAYNMRMNIDQAIPAIGKILADRASEYLGYSGGFVDIRGSAAALAWAFQNGSSATINSAVRALESMGSGASWSMDISQGPTAIGQDLFPRTFALGAWTQDNLNRFEIFSAKSPLPQSPTPILFAPAVKK